MFKNQKTKQSKAIPEMFKKCQKSQIPIAKQSQAKESKVKHAKHSKAKQIIAKHSKATQRKT